MASPPRTVVPGAPVPAALVAGALVAGALVAAGLFVGLEARRVGDPPADWHSWRQALGLDVARGMRCGDHPLHPRLAGCGDGTTEGVVPMELPAYAWAYAAAGALVNPWTGPRLVQLAAAVLGVVGLALLLFRVLSPGAPVPLAIAASVAGSAAAAWSPLARHWLASLLPDGIAWGLALLGGGLAVHLGPRRPGPLAAASLLLGVGIATKLIVAPLLLLTAPLVLGTPPAGSADRAGLRHATPATALHVALALAPALVWYGLWNPHLAALGDCDVFVLAPQGHFLDHLVASRTWRALGAQLAAHAEGLGAVPALGFAVALVVARLRAIAVLATSVAGFLLVTSLGWHARIHEYDALAYLPALALGLAGAAYGLGWLALLALGRTGLRWAPALRTASPIVAAVMVVLPGVVRGRAADGRRAKVEAEPYSRIGADLALVLDRGEAVYAARQPWDPRLGYHAARRTRMLKDDGPACSSDVAAVHDCAAYVAPAPGPRCGRAGPFGGRGTAHVYFPEVQLHCGLRDPAAAPDRIRTRLEEVLGPPPGLAPPPGAGRVLGARAFEVWSGSFLDLVLELDAPPLLPASVPVLVDGRPVQLPVPPGYRKVQPGSIVALRARLEGPRRARLELASGPSLLVLGVERAEPLEWSCPAR